MGIDIFIKIIGNRWKMFRNFEKKKTIGLLVLCVSLLVIFFHAAYYGSRKEGYFLDETLSFVLLIIMLQTCLV